jgi:hypothetical protein
VPHHLYSVNYMPSHSLLLIKISTPKWGLTLGGMPHFGM